MKIAVIGAGISGLAAGRELALAGHEVAVFEKSNGFGGRMATRRAGKNNGSSLDHGLPYLQAEGEEFQEFLNELSEKGLIEAWEGIFAHRNKDGRVVHNEPEAPYYIAPKGMNTIGKHLARLLDIRTGRKVGGLTHIGEDRGRKRTWMLNFATAHTESADAVIIATPARQAYALLNTTTDEMATHLLVREIDEVVYNPKFSFLAGYGDVEVPEWNALSCDHEDISWISNENSKRDGNNETTLVVHTTPEFARKHIDSDREKVAEIITDQLAEILDGWAALPEWRQVHLWRYSQTPNPLPHTYMEIEGKDTPLALVGDYLNGNTIESAYISGKKLGKHWAEKYSS